ncbi:MAG: hypothetical protein ACYDA9_15180 [Terriglobia bacterium]
MRKELIGKSGIAATLALLTAMWCSVLFGQLPRAPLTNSDVVRMVKTGEASIIASIQASPAKFDLSPQGLLALRQAGVSEQILRAMVARGSGAANVPNARAVGNAGGTNANKPYPQHVGLPATPVRQGNLPGQPPRKLTPQQLKTLLTKVHSGKGKLSPVVTNPAATQANAPILAALRQQKQTAMVQRNQIPPPAARPAFGQASMARTAVRPATPLPPSGPNRAVLGAQASINVACATFGSPIIQAVSGQSGSAAVFTQDPAYNPFTIKGCNFGNAKGQAQLNFSNGRKLANLTVDTWGDSLITVEVDPTVTDVLDQNNVSLVLFPASGPQATKSGFRFYAMRRELLLSTIPAGAVKLAQINDDAGSPVAPQYSSPYKDQWTNQYLGMSAGVDRTNSVRFPGGTDAFIFSGLKPGFVLEKYQVKELSAAGTSGECGIAIEQETDYTDGTWGWQMTGNTIQVSWQEAHAHIECEDESDASYGLNVWVVGPALSAGGSPWQ